MGWGTVAIKGGLSRAAAVIWVDPSLISWLKSTLSLLRGARPLFSLTKMTSPRGPTSAPALSFNPCIDMQLELLLTRVVRRALRGEISWGAFHTAPAWTPTSGLWSLLLAPLQLISCSQMGQHLGTW